MRNIAKVFLISLLLLTKISALTIGQEDTILSKVEFYDGSKSLDLKSLDSTLFKMYDKSINLGLHNKEVWVKMDLYNKTNNILEPFVVFKTTHIDSIKVYKKNKNKFNKIEQNNKNRVIQGTLFPYFSLSLKPNESKSYLINIKASQIPTSFAIKLENKESFFKSDRLTTFIDTFILGLLFAVAIFFIVIFFNTKESSFLFFALFILASLYYLFSYTGLSKIYASSSYATLDKTLFIIKLNIIIVLFSLYAILFLKLSKKGFTYKLYMFIIFASIAEIITTNFYGFSYYFVLLISGLFAVINIVAGIRLYLCAMKGIRLYLVGTFILTFGVYANIFNSLNVDFIYINSAQFMLIYALAALAFAMSYLDRYVSTKKEDYELIATSLDKKLILDSKIKERQKELKQLENTQDILKHNINSVIKNNLNTIISMLRLQEPKINTTKILEELKSLENRLLSIVKTYSLFLSANNPNFIIMKDYIEKLVDNTLTTHQNWQNLKIDLDIDATLKLEDAINIGISVVDYILNRLNTNQNGTIYIYLKNENDNYQFNIKDNEKDIVKRDKFSFKKLLNSKVLSL